LVLNELSHLRALPQLACSRRSGWLGVYDRMLSLVGLRLPLGSEFSRDTTCVCLFLAGVRDHSGKPKRPWAHDHRPCHRAHDLWPALWDLLAAPSSRRHAPPARSSTVGVCYAFGLARPSLSWPERRWYGSHLRRAVAAGGTTSRPTPRALDHGLAATRAGARRRSRGTASTTTKD
jgi:hypothetical protein